MNGHTRNLRRGNNLAAALCKAMFAGESPSPADIARLFCALQLADAGYAPEIAWAWPEQEVLARIETSVELRPPVRALERKG